MTSDQPTPDRTAELVAGFKQRHYSLPDSDAVQMAEFAISVLRNDEDRVLETGIAHEGQWFNFALVRKLRRLAGRQ